MPWEKEYGYAQAVKVGDTIYVSGQVSHDETGKIVGRGDMEAQIRQAYTNIKMLLAQYGVTMDNIVDEILFVIDMNTAFPAAVKCRKEIFSGTPSVASRFVKEV
jgi:2-iminobutanoate/2-iminopropanoate deaminase